MKSEPVKTRDRTLDTYLRHPTTQTALQSGYGSLRGTLFIFLLKVKTGTLFGHSSSAQCLHAASSGTKRINNNKNSRTRGRKSGGVEDQPQCTLYIYTSVILGQGGERFSAVQLPEARGFKGILGP